MTRLRVSPEGAPVQDRCQATLVRLLSITEAFASEVLSREVDEHSLARRGQEQQRSYKDWFGVKVDWTAVDRLAEARNAVAHGLGKLTRRQLRSEQRVKSKLKAAGIAVDDNRIVLSDSSLAATALACRDFIERLDFTVQDRT